MEGGKEGFNILFKIFPNHLSNEIRDLLMRRILNVDGVSKHKNSVCSN